MEVGATGLTGLMLAVHLSRRDTGAVLSHDLHVEVSSATDSQEKQDMYRVSIILLHFAAVQTETEAIGLAEQKASTHSI